MVKKLCILGILLCYVLTGCGNVMKTGTSKAAKTTDDTIKVLAEEIEKIEEDRGR